MSKANLNRQQGGFTLIELVVVITILGILAAFAIPRFASLEREARIASIQGLTGSVRSAAAMSHGLWLAQNSQSATPITQVSLEGNPIDIVNGYPDAVTIEDTLSDINGFTAATAGSTTTFTKDGAPTPATCFSSYTQAAAANTQPVIATDFDGC